jgi:hypothetical protein
MPRISGWLNMAEVDTTPGTCPTAALSGSAEMNMALGLRSLPAAALADRSRDEQLSELIGVIYDAAIDPSVWPRAIERSASFVGGAGAGFYCRDVGASHASCPHRFGYEMPLPADLFRQVYPLERHFSETSNSRLQPPI